MSYSLSGGTKIRNIVDFDLQRRASAVKDALHVGKISMYISADLLSRTTVDDLANLYVNIVIATTAYLN